MHNQKTFSWKRVLPLCMVLVLILLALVRANSVRPLRRPYDMETAVFNTTGTIMVWSRHSPDDAFREILAHLQQLHQLANAYAPDSELSRLNQTAAQKPFACSPELWRILQASRDAYQRTHGAFDISIGPLMHLWGFHEKRKTLPSTEEIQEVLQKIGLDKIQFQEKHHTVYFPVTGMQLNFGGILKGLACDDVAAILQKHNISCYAINLGGNLLLSQETPPGKKFFPIGIRNPRDPKTVILSRNDSGCAYATSGNYERAISLDNQKIGHIMNPMTGKPAEFLANSMTVRAPTALQADILSTAIFVAPELKNEFSELSFFQF